MVLAPNQHKKRATSTVHHKKRYGKHRKQTKTYLKPYWPYLPILAIIALGFVTNAAWAKNSHAVLGYATDVSATNLLNDTNIQRKDYKEQPLKLNEQLSAAAQAKANDMVKQDFWSHVTPSGEQPWQFIKNAGYNYQSAGENLAYGFGTSSATLAGWMGSPEHRANILDKNYQDVGFGIANATNYIGHGPETVIVAMYGQPSGTATSSNSNQKISPLFTVVGSSASKPITANISSVPVSRLQTLIGTSPSWLLVALSFLAGAGIVTLIFKHALAWHKALVKSEEFIIHHPILDVLLVLLVTSSVVVSQAAGNIL